MKLRAVIIIGLLAVVALTGAHFFINDKSDVVLTSVQFSSVYSAVSSIASQSSTSIDNIASSSVGNSVAVSSGSSSSAPLSYPRVDPAEEIGHFLKSMDEGAVPKINFPEPKRDDDFDYTKLTIAQLKAKALAGDPFAAVRYANYVRNRVLRVFNSDHKLIYEPNHQKHAAALAEMREFYVRAMAGGIKEAALALSQEYASSPLGNRVESLAWRKVSFAMGESENFDCLRDSTSCVVKDFNNLNRDEYFYPCVYRALDYCKPEDYEDATLLALQYVNSFDYAMHNSIKK